jgi:hypothetical protein
MSNAATQSDKRADFKPSRREFAGLSAAALSGAGVLSKAANAAPIGVTVKDVTIPSHNGQTSGQLFGSATGEYPGLVMFASAAASREANAAVAQQLATQGWNVLLVKPQSINDPTQLNRDARAHYGWLAAQAGIQAPAITLTDESSDKHGFTLHSFSAAFPKLSLASRDERRTAAANGVLFAVPDLPVGKSSIVTESLRSAARSLHRLAT